MTDQDVLTVTELKRLGLGYKRISVMTGIPANTIKSFFRRHEAAPQCAQITAAALCRFCGSPIEMKFKQKTRKFCSDQCRQKWWNSHREEVCHRKVYSFQCPQCGKSFQAFNNPNRKYCSKSCAARARTGGADHE